MKGRERRADERRRGRAACGDRELRGTRSARIDWLLRFRDLRELLLSVRRVGSIGREAKVIAEMLGGS